MPDILRFALAVGLVWRVSHAVAAEDGPFDIFSRFQEWVGGGRNWVGRGLACGLCVSWWLAVPAVALVGPADWAGAVLWWGGIAGAAALLHKVIG